jgi:ATP-dependent DNA helicase RecQ
VLQTLIPEIEPAMDDPLAVLRRVFGFPGFRGSQEAVISHVIGGGDALVLMPTGGGKSVC